MFNAGALYSDLPPALDVGQAAAVLGCHPDTVRNLIDRGDLRSVRVGRLIRIPRHAVLELLGAETDAPGAA